MIDDISIALTKIKNLKKELSIYTEEDIRFHALIADIHALFKGNSLETFYTDKLKYFENLFVNENYNRIHDELFKIIQKINGLTSVDDIDRWENTMRKYDIHEPISTKNPFYRLDNHSHINLDSWPPSIPLRNLREDLQRPECYFREDHEAVKGYARKGDEAFVTSTFCISQQYVLIEQYIKMISTDLFEKSQHNKDPDHNFIKISLLKKEYDLLFHELKEMIFDIPRAQNIDYFWDFEILCLLYSESSFNDFVSFGTETIAKGVSRLREVKEYSMDRKKYLVELVLEESEKFLVQLIKSEKEINQYEAEILSLDKSRRSIRECGDIKIMLSDTHGVLKIAGKSIIIGTLDSDGKKAVCALWTLMSDDKSLTVCFAGKKGKETFGNRYLKNRKLFFEKNKASKKHNATIALSLARKMLKDNQSSYTISKHTEVKFESCK